MRIDVMGFGWANRSGMIRLQLAEWGYPLERMMLHGLNAEGYLVYIPNEDGRKQFDETNNAVTERQPWADPEHWEWMLAMAPLIEEES